MGFLGIWLESAGTGGRRRLAIGLVLTVLVMAVAPGSAATPDPVACSQNPPGAPALTCTHPVDQPLARIPGGRQPGDPIEQLAEAIGGQPDLYLGASIMPADRLERQHLLELEQAAPAAAAILAVLGSMLWVWQLRRSVARRTASLTAANQRLQRSIEEEEITNEELQMALSQLREMSEELRAANEELQVTTEELQATNDELATEILEKTRVAAALRESEEGFRGVFETAPHGIALVSIEGRWLKVNPALCNIVGYAESELLGTTYQSITHPEDVRLDRAQSRALLDGSIDSYRFQKRYIHRDGAVRWVELSVGLVRDAHLAPLHFIVHIHDITEPRRIAEEIERTRRNLAHAQEIAELGSWEWDLDDDTYFWSDQTYRIFGVVPNRFVPTRQSFLQCIHAEDRSRYIHGSEAAIRGDRPYDLQFRIMRSDGAIRHLHSRGELVRDEHDQTIGAIGTMQDITTLKLAEDALAYRNLLLTVQQATSPDGIVLVDRGGQIRSWNRRFLEIWNLDEERLTALGSITAVARNSALIIDADGFCQHLHHLLDHVEVEENGTELVLRDGRTFEQFSKGVAAPRNRFVGRVWFLRDITARKRAEEGLFQAKEEAEFANRAKSEFLAMMSHELRTPLNAIIGFSDTIRLEVFGPLGSRKYADYIADIHDSGMHLLELINDILDVSAIEAGKLELHDENLDLTRVASSSFRLVRSRAEKGQIYLNSRLPADLPLVIADKRRLTQILLNLLTNSVKFTPAGGEVWLTGARLVDGRMELQVGDTGIGMDEPGIAKALSMFGRVDNRLSREGTGLGLPLTKRLIEAHGGTLQIASQPGVGTVVTMTFPAWRVAG